jgi:ATP adenylyltransferase
MKVYNPYRSKYDHNYNNPKCPFCNKKIIEKQNISSLEGKNWMVFINQYPILDGNLMLILKRHIEDTSELDKNEWEELQEKIEQAKTILSKIFDTKSFNIGFNIGADSGSSVKHLHWQIIPRANRQPINGFAGFIAGIQNVRMSPEELKKKILDLNH